MPDPGTFDTQAPGAPDTLAIGFVRIRGLRSLPCEVTYSVGYGPYLVLCLTEVERRKLVSLCWVGMYKTHRAGSPFQRHLADYRDGEKVLRPPRRRPVDPSVLALNVPPGWGHDAFRAAHGDSLVHTYVGPERAAIVRYSPYRPSQKTHPRFHEINRLLEWAPDGWVNQKHYIEIGPAGAVGDEPLSSGVREEVVAAVERARASLNLPAGAPPADVQQAIYDAVNRVLAAKARPPKSALQDLAIELGSLWGEAVCAALGWEWRRLEVEGVELFAVATPDRSHYVAPMPYLKRQLTQRRDEAENTTLLLFNMLKAGKLPHSPPRGYKSLG